jgi:hypothetical protein
MKPPCLLVVDDSAVPPHLCPGCQKPVHCRAVVFRGDDWYHLICVIRQKIHEPPEPSPPDPEGPVHP